ncbi:MAG TPA: ABC transporter permease [Solirubrobacteraceae bacterium]|jgi:ABC-type dipeptide/oligopeptide/nickel transport system permease subunit|nr:ABC transporter permease [Solirubrobacteraceae bacterium]
MGAGAAEIFSGADAGLGLLESGGEIAARSPLQLFWRRFRRDRIAQGSGAFILLLIVVAIFAPLVVKLLGLPSPYTQNPNLTGPFGEPLGPSSAHPFGVDSLGQDVASRVIYGTRVSLEVGVLGTAIAALIGVVLGLLAGYYRGWIDSLISFVINVTLSIPVLLLGLGIGAACAVRGCAGGTIQPGVGVIIFLIAFATWAYFARIVRGLVLSLREREFVEAARVLGASDVRIMFREILPNLVAPIIVYATLQIPLNILIEAGLSFLGVGVRPPTASWGQMIAAATPTFNTAWWYMVFPGAALLLTVLAFNLLGDGLRDALNPRTA